MYFDGQGGYVQVNGVGNINSTFTAEMWLRIPSTSWANTRMVLLSRLNIFELRFNNSALQMAIGSEGIVRFFLFARKIDYSLISCRTSIAGQPIQLVLSTTLSNSLADQFFHAAFVFSKGNAAIIVNGVQFATQQSISPHLLAYSVDSIYVGRPANADRNFFGGYMSEVRNKLLVSIGETFFNACELQLRLWNVNRTVDEIGDAMTTRLTGDQTGLLKYLPFSDDSNSDADYRHYNLASDPIFDRSTFPAFGMFANSPNCELKLRTLYIRLNAGWSLVAFADNGAFQNLTIGGGSFSASRRGVYVDENFFYRVRNSSKLAISWNVQGYATGSINSYAFAVSVRLPSSHLQTLTCAASPPPGEKICISVVELKW
jgi:hypothetical protein